MQKRRLGRTDLQVSIVGFGGMWLSDISKDEATRVVKRAFELGINYFDTARGYGNSEKRLGLALQDVRDECVIASKIGSRTKKESLVNIKRSLQALQTDKIDILQLHGIDDSKTLKKAMSPQGALETCRQTRSKGLVDYIGISSHRPNVLIEALETGEFDMVLVPLNVVTRQPLEKLLSVAKEHDVGVAVMKPLAAKIANILTWKYSQPLSLLSDEPELEAFLGGDTASRVRNALSFILAQDISTVVPGFKSVKEVEVAANVGREFKELTSEEEHRFKVSLKEDCCRDCGLCLPCPRKLNIPALLRFYDFCRIYGLRKWGKKLYYGLDVKADDCNQCGICESKCPYSIPIRKFLRNIRKIFQWKTS